MDLKREELVERMKKEPGMAYIKPEFLDVCHEKRVVWDHLPRDVAEEVMQVASDAAAKADSHGNEGPPSKKAKLKGRNKGRPIEKRPTCDVKLCSSIVHGQTCSYGDRCKFLHDFRAFMAAKPKDIGDKCYIFQTYGYCPFGLTCRFGSMHIDDDLKNVTNEELKASTQGTPRVRNVFSKDLQHKLWKHKYDFSKAQQIFNSVNIKKNKDKNCNDASLNSNKSDGNGLSYIENQPEHEQAAENCDTCVDDLGENAEPAIEASLAGGDVADDAAAAADNDVAGVPQLPRDGRVDEQHATQVSDTTGNQRLGPVSDEDLVRLRPEEKRKVNFAGKLYLSPLTTVGNLPFRRICKSLGADVTCCEMAVSTNLLKGQQSEWALLKRHPSEDLFGIQICGGFPDNMMRCAQLLSENVDFDFLDINCGCPIDLVFNKGEGCGLMGRMNRLEPMVKGLVKTLPVPLTVKMRAGITEGKYIAHTLVPRLREWGVSMTAIHGRTRQQRYTRLADWDYIGQCAKVAGDMPLFGNGDVLSYEDYNLHMQESGVSGMLIARGALIKPWLFTEIKEQRHWDISATERWDMLQQFVNFGLDNWGSDDQGVATTRRFLLEWLSFLYRYIPVGLLERVPQRINERPVPYFGRSDLETLLASGNCADWIKISEMLLGPVPSGFTFAPKHKANAYQ